MKSCTYFFNKTRYDSIEALREALKDSEALDILFSSEIDERVKTADTLKQASKQYALSKKSRTLEGTPDVETKNGYYTTQTIIDSGITDNKGNLPMLLLDLEDHKKALLSKYINEDNLSEEEANVKIQTIQDSWDKIAKDSADLHKIIVGPDFTWRKRTDLDFRNEAKDTSFSPVFDKLRPVVESIEKNIWMRLRDSIPLKNINLEADLRGMASKIIGHIDYLFIRPNGDIEIFNLKASIYPSAEWSSTKKEHFKYELAFLKRILEFHGINSLRVRVNLIPVRLKYDNEFKNIEEIYSEEALVFDSKDVEYIFLKYDNFAASLINSNVKMEDLKDDVLLRVNTELKAIFPTTSNNIRYNGIRESTKGWIRHNWKYIAKYSENGPGWDITFPGEKEHIHISDTRRGDANEELISLVEERTEELFGDLVRDKNVSGIISDILNSYLQGLSFPSLRSLGAAGLFIKNQLDKYFEYDKETADGKPDYKWRFYNDPALTSCNLLLFRHTETDLLDVIALTPYDVSAEDKILTGKLGDNLLGSYLGTINKENFTLKSDYGNIEAIRTMTLLNHLAPTLGFKPKLGTLKLVGVSNHITTRGREYDMGALLKEFNTVIQVVNRNNNGLNMENKFLTNNIKSIDSVELLLQTYKESLGQYKELRSLDDVMTNSTSTDGSIILGLESLESIEAKLNKLNVLINRLKDMALNKGISLNPDDLRDTLNKPEIERKAIARMYIDTMKAILKYNGDYLLNNEDFSTIKEYANRPQSIPNSNVRVVTYMFLKSINRIADLTSKKFEPLVKIFNTFYEKSGYTNLRNMTVGDLANMFNNLYETLDGEKTMRFKNPYDNNSDLKDYERAFLKDMLWELNKVRSDMRGFSFNFSSKEDPRLIEAIKTNKDNLNYLNVPLEQASKATKRLKPKLWWKEFYNRWSKRLFGGWDAWLEVYLEWYDNVITEEQRQARDLDIHNLQAYNPFLNLENENIRINMLNEKGTEYFETNVRNIVIDFIEKLVLSEEYNKMLVRTKAVLLDLAMRGEAGDNLLTVERATKAIEDFISINVFNKSIMEASSLKIASILEPLRSAVTKSYIMANPAAAVRDVVEGLLLGITRTALKFLTDLTTKNLAWGYKEIILDVPNNIAKMSKWSALNTKYRFSNIDIARISEGYKMNQGLVNWENIGFATLRCPDYLNRMVLFAGRCKLDGVEDAYYVDEDGILHYDWTRDKRFTAYSLNNTSDPEYNHQRSLYLSLLRQFNIENGTELVEGDALPDAYTLSYIELLKNFSNNIYAGYDTSTKWKWEFTALGRFFTPFVTWLNAINDVYFKNPGLSLSTLKWELEKDENGNLLYFDKFGRTVTLENGGNIDTPVMTLVPIMVLGIWYTFTDTLKILTLSDNKIQGLKELFSEDVNKRNAYKLFSDALISLLFSIIFSRLFKDLYKDHKENTDPDDVIKNGLVEVTYNGVTNAWEGFMGPYALINYFGNSTNPATYKLAARLASDAKHLATGDLPRLETLMNMLALPRAVRDTYKIYMKAHKETLE